MNINLQLQLDQLIAELPEGRKPSLLLHSCCGPCSTYVLHYLSKYFNIDVFFYNPNIMPESEFDLRLEQQKIVLASLNQKYSIGLITPKYNVTDFLDAVKGLENEPERGKRCTVCMDLRLKKTAKYAKENNYDYFCTTLSVSPHKDAALIHSLSKKYEIALSIPALPGDFKKKGGFQESISLSKELDLYRQNYCGCIYSKNNKL